MNTNYELKTEEDKEEKKEINKIQDLPDITSKKSFLPKVAGILLIIAGLFALINWISILFIDIQSIEEIIQNTQLQQTIPTITPEQALGALQACAIIFIIISIFPVLGGILSIKRKLFGITLACSIIGIFSIGILFLSSVFSIIALILLIVSRKEYYLYKK
jgi:hypothetical protein